VFVVAVRVRSAELYAGYSAIAGPLQPAGPGPVRVSFRPVLKAGERAVLGALIFLNLVLSVGSVYWLLLPEHFPRPELGQPAYILTWLGFGLLVTLEALRALQAATIWLWAWLMRDPVPLEPPAGLRVAVLTTIVPDREPVELLARTLEAMRRIRYPQGTVDVWVLDEGDDPEVKRLAARLGVNHFSRRGRPEYNRPEGRFRARTKHGNHNAWQAEHAHKYDIVAQMDPDHVPFPDFLERTLGYFRDPEVAFVVAPQVYRNLNDSFVAHGAADQAYIFHGVVQRGANAFGAPLLVGTNHLYRVTAWRQIGGYQDSIIEDHLTSLTVHGTVCPATGRPWKGVYTPDILSVGEGPRTWTDYFNQQRRWAYGVWEVILKHDLKLLPRLPLGRLLSYLGLQIFYPSVGLIWLLGAVLTGFYLVLGVTYDLPRTYWAVLLGTLAGRLALFVWLRRFNLAAHERRGIGLSGLLLTAFTSPVYLAAGVRALLGLPLGFVVTAKGRLASADGPGAFGLHLQWFGTFLGMLFLSQGLGHTDETIRVWAYLALLTLGVPPLTAGRRLLRLKPAGGLLTLAALGLVLGLTVFRWPVWASAGSGYGAPAPPPSEPRPLKFGIYRPALFNNPGYVERVEAELGVRVDLVMVFQAWGDKDAAFAADWYASLAASGREVLVSWEPWSRGRAGPEYALEAIARGEYDGYLWAWARGAAATPDRGRRLIIRFAHEMDGSWYPWSGRPEAYRQAFRRIVEVFRRAGAESRFMFSPAWAMPEVVHYYPGSDVTDYVGVTVLDFGREFPEGGKTFSELFSPQYPVLRAFGKPIILAEVAVNRSGGYQAEWLAGMFWSLKTDFPEVAAVVYFDGGRDRLRPQVDWSLNRDGRTLGVLRAGLGYGERAR
jgi:hypothetical protein